MNGIGVGTTVALGCLISLLIVAPGMELGELFATLFFYGGITGLLFELYRFAFNYKRPFDRR
jgi:hypothetical protein